MSSNDTLSDDEENIDEMLLNALEQYEANANISTAGEKRPTEDGDSKPQHSSKKRKHGKYVHEDSPLVKYRHGYLWVSDLTSQCWCEQKMEYTHTMPVVEVENPIMTAGTDLHLARELEVQDKVQVEVTSDEDIFAIKIINILGALESFLAGIPIRREIPIFGAPFDHNVFITGLIDEIRCDVDTFQLDVVELKTRTSSRMPHGSQFDMHCLQAVLYRRMFDDIILGKTTHITVSDHLGLDMDKPLGKGIQAHTDNKFTTLKQLFEHLTETAKSLPCISQTFIEYCSQESGTTIGIKQVDKDDTWLKTKYDYYMSYWKGDRTAEGVDIEDAWKCQMCDFADVCEWRAQKDKMCQNTNKC